MMANTHTLHFCGQYFLDTQDRYPYSLSMNKQCLINFYEQGVSI
jgi:hypothetical protein